MKSRLGLKLLLCVLSYQIHEVFLTALLFPIEYQPSGQVGKLAIHLAHLL